MVLKCDGCIYEPHCPSEVHCQGCARIYVDKWTAKPDVFSGRTIWINPHYNEPVEDNPPCYLPEKDNPYPLCVGRGMKACAHCTLWGDYDPDENESRVNRPLTRSQMVEMNGQPVWCEEMGLWAILYIEDGGVWCGIPFITGVYGLEFGVATQFNYNVQDRNLTLYKYKPAEEKEG